MDDSTAGAAPSVATLSLTDSSLAISPPLAAGSGLPFVIPNTPSLAGASANFQAIVVGPNLNAASALPTDELLLTIGR